MNKFVIFYVSVIAVVLVFSLYSSYAAKKDLVFVFTWGPDVQGNVEGTFRLEIKIDWNEENIAMVVRANDDEYDEWDYVGLVFDTNQNGYIDRGDEPYGLWANNLTAPSVLVEKSGLLAFAEIMPHPGPQKVTFNSQTGYEFEILFPYYWHNYPWTPSTILRIGCNNPLHVCFYDNSGQGATPGVSVRFTF